MKVQRKVSMSLPIPNLIQGYRDDLKAPIESMPISQLLGLKIIGFNLTQSVVELPIKTEITIDGKIVQGGIVGTLADFAAVSAATANKPIGWTSATTSFDVHNLAPAVGKRLVAVGRVIKASANSGVAAADVYAEQSGTLVLVATALATCRFIQLK
jgi:uncharacterized protein (TIGR00369 family)